MVEPGARPCHSPSRQRRGRYRYAHTRTWRRWGGRGASSRPWGAGTTAGPGAPGFGGAVGSRREWRPGGFLRGQVLKVSLAYLGPPSGSRWPELPVPPGPAASVGGGRARPAPRGARGDPAGGGKAPASPCLCGWPRKPRGGGRHPGEKSTQVTQLRKTREWVLGSQNC